MEHQSGNSLGNYNYNFFTYSPCVWHTHFHLNYEVAIVLSGECTVTVNQTSKTVKQGEAVFIFPNLLHSYETPKNAKVFIAVFSEDFIFKFAEGTKSLQSEDFVFHLTKPAFNFINEYIIKNQSSDIYILKACFYTFCHRFLAENKLVEKEKSNTDFFNNICNYIAEHFKENITLKKISEEFGFEYHYLSRKFHDIFKINLPTLINQYRINYASDLLEQGNKTITEIALLSGFQSVRNFNKTFKSIKGFTPREQKFFNKTNTT